MKRLVSIFLAVLICFSLVSCGNKDKYKELGIDEQHYKLGMNALKIIEQWQNFDLTTKGALSSLKELTLRYPLSAENCDESPQNYWIASVVDDLEWDLQEINDGNYDWSENILSDKAELQYYLGLIDSETLLDSYKQLDE
jgi:hypothetical protein